ncbi:MAG: GNAT family N-acetyltransferase [Fimbriimonadaceae bacterium]
MWDIRPVTSEDVSGAVAVVQGVFQEYGFRWEDGDYYADLYDPLTHYPAPGGFWVAIVDEKIVGTVGLDVFDPLPGGESPPVPTRFDGRIRVSGVDCSLERLYLLAEHRGKGLGKALFQTAITEAKEKGRRRMEIWSDKLFAPAHSLYGLFGAVIVADRLCDDPDESPEWGLSLDL